MYYSYKGTAEGSGSELFNIQRKTTFCWLLTWLGKYLGRAASKGTGDHKEKKAIEMKPSSQKVT